MSGEDSGRPTCLIVLGMHRSGTSALVRVANLLGYALPATLLGGKSTSNPKGHWESLKVNRLNDDILAVAGLKWRSLEPIGDALAASGQEARMRARALDTIAQEYGKAPFFVLKDPRLSLLLPFWLSVFDEFGAQVRIVSLTRDPVECAASLEVRNGLGIPFGELLWLRYVLEGERASRSLRRAHVSYNQLLADWRFTAARMSRDGGITFPIGQDAASGAINAFLSPDERHHRVPPDQSRAGWTRTVAEIMARWADDGENETDHAVLDKIRTAFDDGFDQLGDALQVGTEGTLRANKSQVLRSAANRALKDAKLLQLAQAKQLKELSGKLATDQALLEGSRELAEVATRTSATLATEIVTRRRDVFRAQRDALRTRQALAIEHASIEQLAAARADTINRLEADLGAARDTADRMRGELVSRDAHVERLQAVIQAQEGRLMDQEAAAEAARRKSAIADRRLARAAVRANAALMLRQRLETRDREIEAQTGQLSRLAAVLADATDAGGALRKRIALLETAHRDAEHQLAAATAARDAAQVQARIDGVRYAQSVAHYQAAIHHRDSTPPARRSLWPYRPAAPAAPAGPAFDGDHALIAASDLFHQEWYLRRYPDVAAAGLDPIRHYLESGADEGRDPGPGFSSSGYLRLAPDVAAARLNPLLHYLRRGLFEGRESPTPADEQREGDRAAIAGSNLFDAAWYRKTYTDLPASADAAENYLDRGTSGDRDPGPLFSSEGYLASCPDVHAANLNPLLHYLRNGEREGRPVLTRAEHERLRDIADIRADPWFDETWYLAAYPEVAQSGEDPAAHYLAGGTGGTFDPGPAFSSAGYLDISRDVLTAGLNPLLHYRRHGAGEGRPVINVANRARAALISLIATTSLFDAAWYLARYPDVARAGVDPATHYLDNGWREGRDASPDFSTVCYLDAMADVREQNVNPLVHYLMHGRDEQRPIAPALSADMHAMVGTIAAHPMFSAGWYAKRNAGALPKRQAAAQHYVALGAGRRRNPGPNFRVDWYEARYPDVAQRQIPAFLHFVQWGDSEGREPLPPPAATDDIRLPTPVRSSNEALSGDRGTAGIEARDSRFAGTAIESGPSAAARAVFGALADIGSELPSVEMISQVAGQTAELLTDLWFVNDAMLRLRIDTPPADAASCTAYADSGSGLAPCGCRAVIPGVPCIVDAKLADGLQPLIVAIHDAEGHLIAEQLIAFPSLARGGLHETEAASGLMSAPTASRSLAAMADRMLARWLAHRGARAMVGALHVVAVDANGTERIFEEATRNWLSVIMGVDVTVEYVGEFRELARTGSGTTDRAAATPRRAAATSLVIGADCVPTIAALIATAEEAVPGADADLLLADPSGGRSVRRLAIDRRSDATGIGCRNPALLGSGGTAPAGCADPLAIAFRRHEPSPASLLFRTPADHAAVRVGDALNDVTVLLDGAQPLDRVMTALRNQAGGERLAFVVVVGPRDAGRHAAAFPDRVRSFGSGDPITIVTRWVLVASAEVVLPDPTAVATLIRIADADDIASAGCLEVRQAGKVLAGDIGGWIGVAEAHGRSHPGRLPFEAVAGEAETVAVNNPAFVLIPAGLWRDHFSDRTPWLPDAWRHFTDATTRQGLRHVTTDRVSVAVAHSSPIPVTAASSRPRLTDLVR